MEKPEPAAGAGPALVLLAAGGSSRFDGDAKQLAEFGGQPLVRRAAERVAAVAAADRLIVVGFQAAAVSAAVEGLPLRVVHNPDWASGQASSVRAAVAALEPGVGAACFVPCDQPFLDPPILRQLVRAWREGRGEILVPAFEGRRGAPVLFDRRLFGELAALEGDEGGRQLLRRHPSRVRDVAIASELPLADVDSVEDLERLRLLL